MNEADALDIVQFAVWTVLTAAAPVVLVAMVVGIGIALIQALTQVQEITLTFVPKVGAMLVVFWVTMSFMSTALVEFFTQRIIPLIAGG